MEQLELGHIRGFMSDKLAKWLGSANTTLGLIVTIAAGIVYGTSVVNKVNATAEQLKSAQENANELHKQIIKANVDNANDILRLREAVLVITVNFQYISNQLYRITK